MGGRQGQRLVLKNEASLVWQVLTAHVGAGDSGGGGGVPRGLEGLLCDLTTEHLHLTMQWTHKPWHENPKSL